jgi:hypothetical protein
VSGAGVYVGAKGTGTALTCGIVDKTAAAEDGAWPCASRLSYARRGVAVSGMKLPDMRSSSSTNPAGPCRYRLTHVCPLRRLGTTRIAPSRV